MAKKSVPLKSTAKTKQAQSSRAKKASPAARPARKPMPAKRPAARRPVSRRGGVPRGMDPREWQMRCDLAAAYRLAHLYGWTDLNHTHFSARIPGPPNHFLLNPFGMFFDEIKAPALIQVDHEGQVIGDSESPANPDGFHKNGK